MKLLCVIDSLGSGGAQSQLVALAIGFREKGHEVSFLIYHNEYFFKESLDEVKIPIIVINESNYIKRLFKMRKVIRKGMYDSVLSFLEAPNLICELAGLPFRRWKLVVGERSSNPNILKSKRLKFFRWFHLFADNIVANSHENIKIIRKINPLLKDKKYYVIYNIIDFEKWKPSMIYSPRKNGKLHLIVVSNHQYLKNAKNFILAIHLLPQKYKDQIIIHWYGRRDSKEVTKAYSEAENLVVKYNLNNYIYFYDPQLSINNIIPEYDALGLFSFYEGLSNSICEAMACGKPVIATDVSDNKLIIENNITGFVIHGFEPKAIMNSLILLLECSNAKLLHMGKNAYNRARIIFNKEIIIDKYLELLNK